MVKIIFRTVFVAVLLFGMGNGMALAKSPEDLAKGIVATGTIYGNMAEENLAKFLEQLSNAEQVQHNSKVLKEEIGKAVENTQKALQSIKDALKNVETGITSK